MIVIEWIIQCMVHKHSSSNEFLFFFSASFFWRLLGLLFWICILQVENKKMWCRTLCFNLGMFNLLHSMIIDYQNPLPLLMKDKTLLSTLHDAINHPCLLKAYCLFNFVPTVRCVICVIFCATWKLKLTSKRPDFYTVHYAVLFWASLLSRHSILLTDNPITINK